MPKYRITSPDGKKYEITAPEGASMEEVMAYAQEHHGGKSSKASDQEPAQTHNIADDMSAGERFLAGIGKGFVDTGRGVKQLLNIGDQEQLSKDIEESRRIDKPLMDTTAGTVGDIAGNIVATAPALAIPGANTIAGGAAIGAGMGALAPSLSNEEAITNTAVGGVGGGAGVALGRLIPSAYNAFIAPFTEKGREKIAGNVLREAVGDDVAGTVAKLKNPEIFVEGSTPNMAEATLNPKIATLLKAVRNLAEGKEAIVGQEVNNNAARLAAIRGIAQDDAAIEAAKAARDTEAKALYSKAGQQNVTVNEDLAQVLSNPNAQAAAKAAGLSESALSPTKGVMDYITGKPVPNDVSVGDLHKLKLFLDDAANYNPQTAADRLQQAGIFNTKAKLLDYLDKESPDYAAAIRAYIEKSRPINQMEVGQALKNKLTPALTESGLPTRERANMFAEAIRNQQATIKKATGQRNATLEDVMTPEQMGTINGILKDLERKANASDLAAARGSDTAQNLIADNMLRNIVGPIGMPQSWASKAIGSAIINSLPRRAIDVAIPSVERKVQGVLADAMTNPELAAQLLEKTGKKSKIAELLYRSSMGLGAQGAINAN